MKKILIVFSVLFCIGAVLMCIGVFAFGGLQSNDSYVTDSVSYPDSITSIRLKDTDATVIIRRTSGDRIEIDTQTPESRPFAYDHQNDSLEITRPSSHKWVFFDFSWTLFQLSRNNTLPYNIRISLPESFSGNLTLETASGDIILDAFSLTGNITLRTSSGDTTFTNIELDGKIEVHSSSGSHRFYDTDATGSVTVSTSSGELSMNNLHAASIDRTSTSGDTRIAGSASSGNVYLRSSSGDHTMINLSVEGELNIAATSGEISLREISASGELITSQSSGDLVVQGLSCLSVSTVTTSGAIRLNNTETGNISLESTSGDVRLSGVSLSGSGEIRTTSGDVTCSFCNPESDFTTITKTNSGSCNRPGQIGSGKQTIRISTSSGDIRITFDD